MASGRWVGEERRRLLPGGIAFLPRDIPHAVRCDIASRAPVLSTPAEFQGATALTCSGASSTASGRTAACGPPFTVASPAVAGSAASALPAPMNVTGLPARR